MSGKPYVWFYHREGGYQIRVRGMADFLLSTAADEIRCYARKTTSAETIRHLFLDLVLPVALSRRGRLSVHASAVALAGGAVGFLGGSGQGKSTLAMAFSRRGFPLLCDDSMVVKMPAGDGLPQVIPAYPGARLWPDSVEALFDEEPESTPVAQYSEKRRFLGAEGGDGGGTGAPLLRLYMLASAETAEIRVERLTPRDAIIELIKCSHLLDVTDREMLKVKFNQVSALAEAVPCFRLGFPHDYARLGEVCEAVRLSEGHWNPGRRARQR